MERPLGPGAPGPLITVVTAVLNGAAHLEQCIQSVLGQSYPHLEFIVIDGGSTDGSQDIVRRYQNKLACWSTAPDRGVYDAFNKGVQASSGDWICVLGSDDYFCAPDVLERMAPVLASCDPEIKLVYGNVVMVEAGEELCVIGGPWPQSKPRLRRGTSIPYTGLMHRRSWFGKYGLYDTTFRIAGDYEMLLRGWPAEDALYVPGLRTCAMRVRGISNHSDTAFESFRELRRAQRLHEVPVPPLSVAKELLHTTFRYAAQKFWRESAMWRLRRWRRSLIGKR